MKITTTIKKYRNGRTWRKFADDLNANIPTDKKIHFTNLYNAAQGKETIDPNKMLAVYMFAEGSDKEFAAEMLKASGVDLVAVGASGCNRS